MSPVFTAMTGIPASLAACTWGPRVEALTGTMMIASTCLPMSCCICEIWVLTSSFALFQSSVMQFAAAYVSMPSLPSVMYDDML
jgi:hypothetical protein